MRKILSLASAALIAAFGMITPTLISAQEATGACVSRTELLAELFRQEQPEVPFGHGLVTSTMQAPTPTFGELRPGSLLEIAVATEGSWSMFTTRPDGSSCVFVGGYESGVLDEGSYFFHHAENEKQQNIFVLKFEDEHWSLSSLLSDAIEKGAEPVVLFSGEGWDDIIIRTNKEKEERQNG